MIYTDDDCKISDDIPSLQVDEDDDKDPLNLDAVVGLIVNFTTAASWHTVVLWHHVVRSDTKSFSIQAAAGKLLFKKV